MITDLTCKRHSHRWIDVQLAADADVDAAADADAVDSHRGSDSQQFPQQPICPLLSMIVNHLSHLFKKKKTYFPFIFFKTIFPIYF